MRIQRNDLVKQFEQIVLQEIKNHNDAILASNVKMESLRRELKIILDKWDKAYAELLSQMQYHKTDQSEKSLDIEKSINLAHSKINDHKQKIDSDIMGIKKFVEKRDSYFLTISGFEEFQKKLDQWLANIQMRFEQQKNAYEDKLLALKPVLETKFSKIAEEFVKIKADLTSFMDEINKVLDNYAVEYAGIVREMEKCKKRCFILEKNIENIYTQLERLKDKG